MQKCVASWELTELRASERHGYVLHRWSGGATPCGNGSDGAMRYVGAKSIMLGRCNR